MARGIDGMTIFRDEEDRARFLSRLGTYAERAAIRRYAWALMSNHYHLVVRTSDQPLSVLMKPLNG
jgi:REP element-mobilizing transposase RayT